MVRTGAAALRVLMLWREAGGSVDSEVSAVTLVSVSDVESGVSITEVSEIWMGSSAELFFLPLPPAYRERPLLILLSQ